MARKVKVHRVITHTYTVGIDTYPGMDDEAIIDYEKNLEDDLETLFTVLEDGLDDGSAEVEVTVKFIEVPEKN